jgi:hypothetical protein
MRPTASVELHALHLHNPHSPRAFRQLAQLPTLQHPLSLFARNPPRPHRPVLINHPIRRSLHPPQLLLTHSLDGQINRHRLRTQMKRNRPRPHLLQKHRGQQMLPRMLLRMIHPPLRIHPSHDLRPLRQRLAHKVPHLARLILHHALHHHLQHRPTPRRSHQRPRIPGLPAALRIKRRPIQRHLPKLFLLPALPHRS